MWDEHWKVDPAYYASVFDVIRRSRVPLLGLNAPKEKVRELSSSGPGTGGTLEDIDTSDPYQKEFLEAIYGGHAKGAGMLGKFLKIQAFREETMAEKAAAWLRREQNKGKKLIILAGGNHINYGFGIPRRLFRRIPVTAYSVNPETFSNEEFLELESLGALVGLRPGQTTVHQEKWSLHKGVPPCKTERDVDER